MYKIAVVDDNEAWRLAIAYLLHQQGYAVATFADPNTFLKDAKHFDLALIDFSMPPRRHQKEIDGCELIRQIKNTVEKPPILVLISAFFTDDVLPHVCDLCHEADACLGKSTSSKMLLHHIQQLLSAEHPSLSSPTGCYHSQPNS